MTYGINTAEIGLADEAAPTSAQTAGGTGNTGFTIVKGGTGTWKVDNAWAHRGTFSYRPDAPAADFARGDVAISTNNAAIEAYIKLDTLPPADSRLLQIIMSSGSIAAYQRADGRLSVFDAAGPTAAQRWVSTTSYAAGTVVRCSLGAIVGTKDRTTGTAPFDGTIRFHVWHGADLESSDPTKSDGGNGGFSSTTENTGNLAFTGLRFGLITSQARGSVHFDDIQWSDTSSAIIGAPAAAAPVNSVVMTPQVKVDASSTSGTPTSQTLTRISGAAVTITGPTSGVFVISFAPGETQSVVVRLVSTNSGGTDTDDYTVAPSGAIAATTDFFTVIDALGNLG